MAIGVYSPYLPLSAHGPAKYPLASSYFVYVYNHGM